MKKLFPILMIIGLSVTSCANWMDNEDFPAFPDSVTLSQHSLTMLVGDTCRLNAVFSPEDYENQNLLWISTVDSIVNIDANKLVAQNVGKAKVVITSAIGLMSDTCRVEVKPAWGSVKKDRYETVVYAAIDPSIDMNHAEVGAFIGEELRGLGERRMSNGITYTVFRIYSPLISSEEIIVPITFRCHMRDKGCVVEFPNIIYFDAEAHGTLSNLYALNLN